MVSSAAVKNFTYLDNSNVYLEGCRVAAVRKKMAGAGNIIEAMNNRVVDMSWQIDYGRLHEFACGDPATIGGGQPLGVAASGLGDSFWKMVERYGFTVTKFDRNFAGKEKKVDVAIAHAMTKDAYSGVVKRGEDEMTLIAGDTDYVPLLQDLLKEGFEVHLVFWQHAGRELRESASKFIALDPYFDLLSH